MKPPREKLEAIFEAAAALETDAQRREYLDRACPDLDLRQEVESLLAAMKDPVTLFETKDDAASPDLESIPVLEQPGTHIGRYKLLQKVGIGGMGVVYMAEQTEPVKRKVALKIIKLGMDTRQVVARFEAERQALAMMDHPNIAKVLDAGATETGRPYFVMELVRGVPITEYCDKNKLSAGQRLDLFMDVCRAIHHAHQKGVIHRDIKPSNVMVTLHDGNPVAKVIDFGIAKATNHNLTEKTLFTNYSQMIGTPAYMSPEQAEMSGLDVDTRTDVYSLGVLLYELLTGTTPFPSKELLSLGYGEMQRVITQEEPPKPSTRLSTMQNEQKTVVANNRAIPEAKIGDSLRGDLDWIVMKSLEKDRTQRYETVNALVMDVTRFLKDEPVTAAAPTLGYQVKKFYRRNRRFVHSAAAVSTLLLLSTAFSLHSAKRAKEMRDIATLQRFQAEKARKDAEASREKEATAKTTAETQLRESLIGQSEAWLASQTPDYQTKVLNALKQARYLPGAENDIVKMRTLACSALAEPFRKLWSNEDNVIPDGDNVTTIASSTESLALGHRNGEIRIIDLKTGNTIQDFAVPSRQPINALAYHKQADVWISCDSTGTVSVWALGSGKSTASQTVHIELGERASDLELLTSKKGFLLFSYRQAKIWHWQSMNSTDPSKLTLPYPVTQNDFTGITQEVNHLKLPPIALHPDGIHLAIAHLNESQNQKNLVVWDLEKQRQVASLFPNHDFGDSTIVGLNFSEDGRLLGSSIGNQIYTTLTDGWKQFSRHQALRYYNTEYAISPLARWIAVGGATVEVSNEITGGQTFKTFRHGGLPIFKSSNELVTINVPENVNGPDSRLRWEAASFKVALSPYLAMLTTKNNHPTGAVFSPDSEAVAIAGFNSVEVKNLATFNTRFMDKLKTPDPDTSVFYEDPAYSPNGRLLAAPYMIFRKEYGIQFWNPRLGKTVGSLQFGDRHGFVCFSPSKPLFAVVAGRNLGIWSYQLENPQGLDESSLSLKLLKHMHLDQDGRWIGFHPRLNQLAWTEDAARSENPVIHLLDLDSDSILPFRKELSSPHCSVSFLLDGTQVALSEILKSKNEDGRETSIQIWDYVKDELISERIPHWEPQEDSSIFKGLSSSYDSRLLSFRSQGYSDVAIYDREIGSKILSVPTLQHEVVWFTAWSPDGNHFMTLGSTKTVNVWNIKRIRKRLAELELDWED